MVVEGLVPGASWDVTIEGSILFWESHSDCKNLPTTPLTSPFGRLRNRSLADMVRNRFAELLSVRPELSGMADKVSLVAAQSRRLETFGGLEIGLSCWGTYVDVAWPKAVGCEAWERDGKKWRLDSGAVSP